MKRTDAHQQEPTRAAQSNHPFLGAKSATPFFATGQSVQRDPFFQPSNAQLTTPVQAKLTVGAAGDKYEQEADRIASQVVDRINNPSVQQTDTSQPIQRMGQDEEEVQMKRSSETIQRVEQDEEKLQMKPIAETIQRMGKEDEELQMKSAIADATKGGDASPNVETSIQQARGSGQAIAENVRVPLEQAFGADFSGVRVHTDAKSDQLNRSIQAKAFTTGQDVFFRQGAYEPGSRSGQELIAHELTHVVQQREPEAISRKFTVYKGFNVGGEEKPILVRSDDAEQSEEITNEVIEDLTNSENSLNALAEFADTYIYKGEKYKGKKHKKKKKKLTNKFQETARRLRDNEASRRDVLKRYCTASHDTGIVYLNSYPHIYFLWSNIITKGNVSVGGKAIDMPEEILMDEGEAVQEYDTVILGVGAAAGYYIMGNLATMTKENTAVIGTAQPWDKDDPMARAIALNHESQAWTLKPDTNEEKDAGEETGYWDDGRSTELTKEIKQVLGAVTWINGMIRKVERAADGSTEITYTDQGEEKTIRCGLVVSALGGGSESLKPAEKAAREKHTGDDGWKPVFTLNEFQRWLKSTIQEKGEDCLVGKVVVVVGANAGVDAAYTCTKAGGKLIWYVGSSIALAAAMKNTNINWANVEAVYYGYGTYTDRSAKVVKVKGSATAAHSDAVTEMTTKGSEKAIAFNRVSGGQWETVKDKIATAKDALTDVYVNASGQDDAEIAEAAGLPIASMQIKEVQDAEKESRVPVVSDSKWNRMRVVYSDGHISSKPLLEEKGEIDRHTYTPEEYKKAESKRKDVSYDERSPQEVWRELSSILEKKGEVGASVNWATMPLRDFNILKDSSEENLLVPTARVQAVAVYQLGKGEDSISTINSAKKGTLIIGAQARPYIQLAGYSVAATDNVEQIVDIGQITPTRQAIQQVTHIAARGAMGKADYTYGTRDEIAATVAVYGLEGMIADLMTEAIIWSRTQPGLGEVRVDKERLDPTLRTARMKSFWDAVLADMPR